MMCERQAADALTANPCVLAHDDVDEDEGIWGTVQFFMVVIVGCDTVVPLADSI